MKKSLITTFLLFGAYLNAVELNQANVENMAKYNEINTNRADVGYAQEYEAKAKEQLNKNYQKYSDINSNKADVSYAQELDKKAREQLSKKQREIDAQNDAKENKSIPVKETPKDTPTKYNDVKKENKSTLLKDEKSVKTKEVFYLESDDDVEVIVEPKEVKNEVSKVIVNDESVQTQNSQTNDFVSSLKYQNKILDRNDYFTNLINDIQKKHENYEKSQITIFYFVSSDMKIESFKHFVVSIDKLKRRGYNVVGRVFFRGLINDSLDGIPNWLKEKKSQSLPMSSNVKYQFHPWAFKYFKLNKVPAYAISNCAEDFTFRTCDNKFLIKGDVTLTEVFDIISKTHKEYKKTYLDLVEVN